MINSLPNLRIKQFRSTIFVMVKFYLKGLSVLKAIASERNFES
jgi:hypothetical protein